MIWFNMRQEPVAYIKGLPVALRTPEEPHINIEVADKEMDAMEVKFVKDIAAREKEGSPAAPRAAAVVCRNVLRVCMIIPRVLSRGT